MAIPGYKSQFKNPREKVLWNITICSLDHLQILYWFLKKMFGFKLIQALVLLYSIDIVLPLFIENSMYLNFIKWADITNLFQCIFVHAVGNYAPTADQSLSMSVSQWTLLLMRLNFTVDHSNIIIMRLFTNTAWLTSKSVHNLPFPL